jgi:hypothetical protein
MLFRLILCVALGFSTAAAQADIVLYRFTGANGEERVESKIPPEFAQNGYEVITPAGDVLRVVPPAPSADEVEQAERERRMIEAYERLRSRFSSVEALQDRKKRELEKIETSISIIKGTMNSINIEIDALVKRAANQERAGRKVSENLLAELNSQRTDLKVQQSLLKLREQQYRDEVQEWNENIEAFIAGEAVALKKKKSQSN